MPLVRVAVTAVLSLGPLASLPAQEALFDGRTLGGWAGDPAVWSVQDGCLCGSTVDHPLTANTFLVWQGEPVADFELSFAVRLEGDNNSGMQYRATPVAGEPFALAGYQCDVHPDPRYFGMLYEERGRGIVATHGQRLHSGRDGQRRVLSAGPDAGAVDLAQWHTMRIEARGNVVRHFVDGALSIEVVDDDPHAARRGTLGLQVHAGPPMRVWFKDLVLRRLPTEEVAAVAAAAAAAPEAGAQPMWIWDRSAEDGEEVFLRREFELPAAPAQAVLAISCDNHFRVYVNGARVGNGDQWEAPRALDVARALRSGRNAIAVHGWNDGGPAGLCAQLSWRTDAARGVVVSGADWNCSSDDPDGWDQPGFTGAGFAPATVLAPLGGGPWAAALAADAFAGFAGDDLAPQAPAPADELRTIGWRPERLLAVPRAFGSWVAMCSDPQGRLYAADQRRGLFRILPAGVGGRVDSAIERVDVDLDGCQGLCWAFGALYAVANGAHTGLFRLTDSDGDDVLDRVELLRAIDGDGEHGAHAVVLSPDREHLLVMCGNHTHVPELARSRVPGNWREDALLPRMDDPNGHAVGIEAPGGFVCQVDRDGSNWELICCGFRNTYDLAVLPSGDVVTYDADMEWDMGTPWYRPTRVLQVLSGVDYGWRSGSTKWPVDYPDTLPGMTDIGPGSPTGMLALGGGALALDWTFGQVHRIDPRTAGGGLVAGFETIVQGKPFPVTDAALAFDDVLPPNGCVYLLTGGRGVQSRLYRLSPEEVPGRLPVPASDRRAERVALESFHGRVDEAAVAAAWPLLGDDDAVLRHAARIAVESQPVAQWRGRALAEHESSWSRLTALLALARQGEAADLDRVLRAAAPLEFQDLDQGQRIAWLRLHELALLRLGPATPGFARALAARLQPLLPSGDPRVDAELCALLAHLDAPELLERALPLLSPMQPDPAPPWAEVAARNDSYGKAISSMLAAMPPTRQLAIANALRTVEHGWTLDQRRAFFAFVAAAKERRGGASYQGYLQKMIDAVWDDCSAAERRELAGVAGKDEAAAGAVPAAFHATPPRGPGRNWQLVDAVAIARAQLDRRAPDLDAGHNLFVAAGCASCHRFAGEGGGAGPDLTSLGNKFAAADVLESILEPSKVVSDQFQGSVLTRTDGSTVFGRVAAHGDGDERVYEVVTATADGAVVRVPAAEVARIEVAKLSPMPTGLVDRLSEGELLDLLAFLLSRGER